VYKDVEGNVLGVFAAARDITAQIEASRNAMVFEENFRFLLQSFNRLKTLLSAKPLTGQLRVGTRG